MFVLRKSTRTSWEQSLGSGLAIALAPAHAQAMVRPRPGSFVYTEAEVEVMLEDIIAFKATGVDGIVFGCLLPNGQVDVETASRCVYLLAALITDDQIGRGRRATTRLAQLWLATLTDSHVPSRLRRHTRLEARYALYPAKLTVAMSDIASVNGITRILTR